MTTQSDLILDLQTLNQISQTLNQATDVHAALNTSLAQLVDLMGMETGWVFVRDDAATDRWAGRGFRLAAYTNLPPALAVTNPEAWDKGCDCQTLCREARLTGAYNEVRCSRLGGLLEQRNGLVVHATSPLRAGDRVLGILNVAAPSWSAFTPRSLTPVSYTHLRAHETVLDLVCRLLLAKKTATEHNRYVNQLHHNHQSTK